MGRRLPFGPACARATSCITFVTWTSWPMDGRARLGPRKLAGPGDLAAHRCGSSVCRP